MLNQDATPLLTLVTGTYDRPDSLKRLYDSVVAHTHIPYELLIADATGTALPFNTCPDTLVIPDDPPKMGHTKGYNRMFRQARGHWVLWLNDDAECEAGYATTAIDFMMANPTIGLGALYYKEKRGDKFTPYHINRYHGTLYANFGILTKEFGDSVGWFDEEFTMYGADNSLAFRTLLADRGIAGIPGTRLIHWSEQDEQRESLQHYRREASYLFSTKYDHLSGQMMRTFKKYEIPNPDMVTYK